MQQKAKFQASKYLVIKPPEPSPCFHELIHPSHFINASASLLPKMKRSVTREFNSPKPDSPSPSPSPQRVRSGLNSVIRRTHYPGDSPKSFLKSCLRVENYDQKGFKLFQELMQLRVSKARRSLPPDGFATPLIPQRVSQRGVVPRQFKIETPVEQWGWVRGGLLGATVERRQDKVKRKVTRAREEGRYFLQQALGRENGSGNGGLMEAEHEKRRWVSSRGQVFYGWD